MLRWHSRIFGTPMRKEAADWLHGKRTTLAPLTPSRSYAIVRMLPWRRRLPQEFTVEPVDLPESYRKHSKYSWQSIQFE